MKQRRQAGDSSDDRKAMRKERDELKAQLAKLYEASADKILKKPRKELRAPVTEVQGGRPESNRRKF